MTKRFFILASAALVVLGIGMWRLGLHAQQDLTAVATGQFNLQQLILAEKTAHDISLHFQFLQTNLRELAQIWRRQLSQPELCDLSFPAFQEMLRSSSVLAIGYAPPGGQLRLYDQDGVMVAPYGLGAQEFAQWAKHAPLKEDVRVGDTFVPGLGPFAGRTVVTLLTRLWSALPGVDEPGLLFFVVDAQAVARRYAHDVRSGQSGYAWVIDRRGVFLDHYVEEFIGQDAFTVRTGLDPSISFERINSIMRDQMLSGGQGTDWYVSGWHRADKGEVKKLIAYHPAPLGEGAQGGQFWSVAVVAPVSEAQDIIATVLAKEMLMAAAFQVMVFFGLGVTIYFSVRWSSSLKSEVEARTAELRETRDNLRDNLKKLLETQERLIRSERFAAIGEAAAHISHEIKNPLIVIGGFARQVRRALDPASKEAHKLEMMEEETRRLEALLGEVRDFTRPVSPRLELGDVNATVWETMALLEAELAGRGVVARTNLAKNLPPAVHDPAQIRQVLINLVKNAAEAMETGGVVTVSTSAGDNFVEVEVKDTGPGLPADQAKLIFNPFYTTKERGTGLGLAVSFRIMTDHHGDLRVASTPGKGCAFTLTLPLERRRNGGHGG